jgi:cytochrome c oxidase assembly factor CtaG
MNSCNYKVNLLTIMVALIILLIITVVGGFIINSFNTRKHKIFWNHINDFYWIFGFVILFAALDAPFYVYIPIISVIGLLSLKVWYESIKNIFNNTYA